MHSTRLAAFAATVSRTLAVFQGFNYGSAYNSGAPKFQSDFEAEFRAARALKGAPGGGFTSARLYTTVQAGTGREPISAIPAAIATNTSLLLGLWCSAGDAAVNNELQALKTAISKYGTALAGLVAGISVGSEDLYRNSPTGILNNENPGKNPADIVRYIGQVRDVIGQTPLAGALVGHVDTWTAWVNGSNQAVIDASDWIGVDAYPYFQETQINTISNSKALFDAAFAATKAAVGGKPVWVTETGYPVSGKTVGLAVPGLENAKSYWDQVGCPMFGTVNVWWYTFQDAVPATPNPSFGLIGNSLTTSPLYDISCKNLPPASSVTSLPTGGASGGSLGAVSGLGSAQASLGTSSFFMTSGSLTTATTRARPNNTANATSDTSHPSATQDTNLRGMAAAVSGSVGTAIAAAVALAVFLRVL